MTRREKKKQPIKIYTGKGLLLQINEFYELPEFTKEKAREAIMDISTESFDLLWQRTFGETFENFVNKLFNSDIEL